MKLAAIHHVAIIVSNYEKARDFYVNKLGFAVVRENFRKERNDWKLDLSVGDGADAIELEIFAEPNPPKRVNRPEACGLRHLAFRVDDVEATVAELAQMGIECEPIRLDSYTKKKMTFFFDPDGLPLNCTSDLENILRNVILFYKDGENSKSKLGGLRKMETSVLIQVPYELESAYSPLEERTDIDYTVMSVDNFNVGDFLIGLYITISSNSIITGVVSGMIWDVIKIVSHDVLDKLRQSSKEKTSEKISEQPNKEDGEQETCIKVSLCVRENSKDEYRIGAEYRINRYLNNEDVNKISENVAGQLAEVVILHYEK